MKSLPWIAIHVVRFDRKQPLPLVTFGDMESPDSNPPLPRIGLLRCLVCGNTVE